MNNEELANKIIEENVFVGTDKVFIEKLLLLMAEEKDRFHIAKRLESGAKQQREIIELKAENEKLFNAQAEYYKNAYNKAIKDLENIVMKGYSKCVLGNNFMIIRKSDFQKLKESSRSDETCKASKGAEK